MQYAIGILIKSKFEAENEVVPLKALVYVELRRARERNEVFKISVKIKTYSDFMKGDFPLSWRSQRW